MMLQRRGSCNFNGSTLNRTCVTGAILFISYTLEDGKGVELACILGDGAGECMSCTLGDGAGFVRGGLCGVLLL